MAGAGADSGELDPNQRRGDLQRLVGGIDATDSLDGMPDARQHGGKAQSRDSVMKPPGPTVLRLDQMIDARIFEISRRLTATSLQDLRILPRGRGPARGLPALWSR